jgi:hypothetical protein
MRLTWVGVAALLAGVAVLSVRWRVPAEVLGIALTVFTTIAGLLVPAKTAEIRTAWICAVLVLGSVSTFAVVRARTEQEAKASEERQQAEERYNADKQVARKQNDDLRDDLNNMKQLLRAAATSEQVTKSLRAGTLEFRVVSLSSEILHFLLDRQAHEPEQQVALMGAMPIPVGSYADYRFETGQMFDQIYGQRVRAAIEQLKNEGLVDPSMGPLMGATPDPDVARQIAEKLGTLAINLPPPGGAPVR